MKQALYYSSLNESNKVLCQLCPHKCVIADGNAGICKIRKNEGGKLYAVVYNKYTSINLDPIEKKPLYHFYPGSKILSIGTTGCNLKCQFCQNYEISQCSPGSLPAKELSSEDIVKLTQSNGSIGVAYTYNEPLINYEHLKETAIMIKENGFVNVLVTNGYINEEPLVNLLPYIDAVNIDVKSFKNEFYRKYCGGSLPEVMRTVEVMFKKGIHIEITNLLIPGLNDKNEEIKELVDWISALSDKIPLHFSRYFPCYKLTIGATPLQTLQKARDIAIKRLKYVYLGNIWEEKAGNTYCFNCGELLIRREGYKTDITAINDGRCSKCGEETNVIGI